MDIFYQKSIKSGINQLDEEEAKHCSQVLRHQVGDDILIFDGIGGIHKSVLTSVSKKNCEFEVVESISKPDKSFHTHLAIAPTKNSDRMEWLIEKLSEIGVDTVSLIQTQHSERRKIRLDRLEKKAISAMKQSGNPFLLQIKELQPLEQFLSSCQDETKLIAHVDDKHIHISDAISLNTNVTILIGPEGDFSREELRNCIEQGFTPISLGQNTLRTETAGFVACCSINLINNF